MLAGLSSTEIQRLCLSADEEPETSAGGPIVTKAVPNIAARCRQSMTILELPESGSIPQREAELTEWIFGQVGSVKWLAEGLVNAGSMLMTACLAALSIPLEGLLDGSVAEGLRRADAMEIAVQGVNGLGAMLDLGMHPAVVRESISSPRGCTIQSLLTVEKAATRARSAACVPSSSGVFTIAGQYSQSSYGITGLSLSYLDRAATPTNSIRSNIGHTLSTIAGTRYSTNRASMGRTRDGGGRALGGEVHDDCMKRRAGAMAQPSAARLPVGPCSKRKRRRVFATERSKSAISAYRASSVAADGQWRSMCIL
ncbi:NADP oxidoreductase [Lasiodiplodia theobromae]|nr:NADP oxidoreductase [Lasiodiplodia theobromae]